MDMIMNMSNVLNNRPGSYSKNDFILNSDCFKTESSFSVTDTESSLDHKLYETALDEHQFRKEKKSVRFLSGLQETHLLTPEAQYDGIEPTNYDKAVTKGGSELEKLFAIDTASSQFSDDSSLIEESRVNDIDLSLLDVRMKPEVIAQDDHTIDEANTGIIEDNADCTKSKEHSSTVRKLFHFKSHNRESAKVIQDELHRSNERIKQQEDLIRELKTQIARLEDAGSENRRTMDYMMKENASLKEQLKLLKNSYSTLDLEFQVQEEEQKIQTQKVCILERQVQSYHEAQRQLLKVNATLNDSNDQAELQRKLGLGLLVHLVELYENLLVPLSFVCSDWNLLRGPSFEVDKVQSSLESLYKVEIQQMKALLTLQSSCIAAPLLESPDYDVEALLLPLRRFQGVVCQRLGA